MFIGLYCEIATFSALKRGHYEIEATAEAYGKKPEFFKGMAHDMMLEDGWQAVADRIIEWLDEKGM